MEEDRRKQLHYGLIGSTAFKIFIFFVMVLSAAMLIVSAIVCYANADLGFYSSDGKKMAARESFEGYSGMYADKVRGYLEQGHPETAIAYLEGTNARIQLFAAEDQYSKKESDVVWQSGEVGEDWLHQDVNLQFSKLIYLNGTYIRQNTDYIFRVCYNPDFPVNDGVRQYYLLNMKLFEFRFVAIWIFAGTALLCVICFVFLMCSAGHKNGREGITPGVFTGMPFDVYTVILLAGTWVLERIMIELTWHGRTLMQLAGLTIGCVVGGTLAVLYLMEFAVRLKLGKWWQNTLIYIVLRGLWRGGEVPVQGNVEAVMRSSAGADDIACFPGNKSSGVYRHSDFCKCRGRCPVGD